MNVGDQVLITGGPLRLLGFESQVKVIHHGHSVVVKPNHWHVEWTLYRKQVMELKGKDV